jgi:hypothetical protein
MRRMGILVAVAAVLGCGCAVESSEPQGERRSEPATGEAGEAFTAQWSTKHFMRTRPIPAGLGATITVWAKADFADPVGCPSAYSVELIRFVSNGEEVVGIVRSYPARNQAHSEIWTALAGGTYKVQFSTTRPPDTCELHGVVTVDVTP